MNHTRYVQLSPPSIDLPKMEVFAPRMVDFFFINRLKDRTITLGEIQTTGRLIYVPRLDDVHVPPQGSTKLNLLVIPSESGFFSEMVFISTSVGVIPFSVTFNAMGNWRDSIVPTLYHFWANAPVNLTLRVPNSVLGRSFSFLYDKQVFNAPETAWNGRHITLGATRLTPNIYVTFVHFMGTGITKTMPLYIMVSAKALQPYHPVVLTGVVTAKDESVETDVRIVNPTSRNVEIAGMSLSGNVPSNVRVDPAASPIVCARQSHTVIGKIVVTGAKEGEIDALLTVSAVKGSADVERFPIQMPVKGAVLYGELVSDKPSIVIAPLQRVNLSIRNAFKVPVMLYSAMTDSPLFEVENFKPVIVGPGEMSPPFSVFCRHADAKSFDACLQVGTNATTVRVPVHGYKGRVTIGDVDGDCSEPMITKVIGKALIGSTVNVTVQLSNPNPLPFVISDVSTTPGIEVNGKWMQEDGRQLIGVSVPAGGSVLVSAYVGFLGVKQTSKRNDTLTLSDAMTSVAVRIEWSPISGSLTLSSDLPKGLILGMNYTALLSVRSTYSVAVYWRTPRYRSLNRRVRL